MTEKLTASELGREAEGKSGVAGRVMVLPMAPNLLPYRGWSQRSSKMRWKRTQWLFYVEEAASSGYFMYVHVDFFD